MRAESWVLAVVACLVGGACAGQVGSLVPGGGLAGVPGGGVSGSVMAPGARLALVALPSGASGEALEEAMAREQRALGASLFAGRAGRSLFAPMAPRGGASDWGRSVGGARAGATAALRDLIAGAEAGPKGYDAVHYGARRPPPGPPSRLTLDQIRAWIRETPGQNHAIGRYQMIPGTLDDVAKALGIPGNAVYSPGLQDRMGDFLLERAGYGAFLAGELSRVGFMNNLAKIWAGLPNSSGKSHYHGHAGNRAVLSWARFEAEMGRIFAG